MRFDEGKTNNFEKESPLQTFKDRIITPAKLSPLTYVTQFSYNTGPLNWSPFHLAKGTALYQIRAKQQRRQREAGKMLNKSLSNFLINC
jgi:hypothetical protein